MYCKTCGTELSSNAAFCPKCGTRVEQVPPPSPPSAPQPPSAPANPEPHVSVASPSSGGATSRSTILVAVLVGVTLGILVFMGIVISKRMGESTSQVSVVIPVDVPNLDKSGTRVPVQITGTSESGSKIQQPGYVEADGSGLMLDPGIYEIKATGSPISGEGVIYDVPTNAADVVLDQEAIQSGETASISETLVFEPLDAASVTDEQIDAALELAQSDSARDQQVCEELANLARTARDEAQQKAYDEERARYTLHVANINFLLPEGWRDTVAIKQGSGDSLSIEYEGVFVLSVSTPQDAYWWQRGMIDSTIPLASGGSLAVTPNLDDGGVAGRLTDVNGNVCDLATWCYDGKQFGGWDTSTTVPGRTGQQLATGLGDNTDGRTLAVECLRVCAENITFG